MNAPHRRNFITLRSQVLDSLLDIIDVEDDDDGEDDHDIGFREFARVMTAADVFKMKALAPRPTATHLDEREQARQEALQYLRPGVLVSPACEPASQLTLPWLFDTCAWVCQCEELRKFQEQVKNKITAKYGKHSFSSAFKWIDADRTGSITREEFKQAMRDFNLSGVRENILDTLCDFIDQDGSGSCVQPANERVRADSSCGSHARARAACSRVPRVCAGAISGRCHAMGAVAQGKGDGRSGQAWLLKEMFWRLAIARVRCWLLACVVPRCVPARKYKKNRHAPAHFPQQTKCARDNAAAQNSMRKPQARVRRRDGGIAGRTHSRQRPRRQ